MPKYTSVRFHTSESPIEQAILTGPGPVKRAAHPDVGGPFLGGDAVILARSHRQLPQPELLTQRAQPSEVRPRFLRIAREGRHRRQAADLDGAALDEGLELLGADAGLRLLAGEVHLDERRKLELLRGRLRVERVHELADRADRLRLPALEVADEVP